MGWVLLMCKVVTIWCTICQAAHGLLLLALRSFEAGQLAGQAAAALIGAQKLSLHLCMASRLCAPAFAMVRACSSPLNWEGRGSACALCCMASVCTAWGIAACMAHAGPVDPAHSLASRSSSLTHWSQTLLQTETLFTHPPGHLH